MRASSLYASASPCPCPSPRRRVPVSEPLPDVESLQGMGHRLVEGAPGPVHPGKVEQGLRLTAVVADRATDPQRGARVVGGPVVVAQPAVVLGEGVQRLPL